ncbi:phage integrase family protein [Naumannella halotolerans]|uniref:Phage integrase family protein n=2 Tax=Naumannella halotolerans TaxID=993414 RepID=A0A4R7J2B9_9ACTN|nr:phage integrase family protein [Naumannella halotolerans]
MIASACARIDPLYGDYVRLAALTGLRAGELTALQPQDVDLAAQTLRVQRAHSRGKIGDPKSKEPRTVPVVAPAARILGKLTASRRPTEFLFSRPGGRLHHSNFRTAVGWTQLVTDAGFPGLRFHDLRGVAISTWIQAGIDLATVRSVAGHSDLRMTDRYSHLTPGHLSSARSQIESYLGVVPDDQRLGGGEGSNT